jgi:hypothetical protein
MSGGDGCAGAVAPVSGNALAGGPFPVCVWCFPGALFVSSAVAPDMWNRFHTPGRTSAPEERSPKGTCHLAGFYAPRQGGNAPRQVHLDVERLGSGFKAPCRYWAPASVIVKDC